MKHHLRLSMLSALCSVAFLAFAGGPALAAGDKAADTAAATSVSPAERARITALLEQKTGMKATNVETSPLQDFYTVTVDFSVYYMDKSGKWLFDGHLVDVDTKTSVTAIKRLAIEQAGTPAMDWRTLNLNDAIKTVRGRQVPGRVLVTFEDPNCTFCKRLHTELEKLQDITVYTFPVAFLGPDSQAKNEAIWCSSVRAASWAAAMTGQPVKVAEKCDIAALKRNSELASKLMVRGTPTMFLADGTRVPGYMEAAAIEAKLSTQVASK